LDDQLGFRATEAVDQGFTVAKSFGCKYVQFDAEPDQIKPAL
jgi:hypothetical protein